MFAILFQFFFFLLTVLRDYKTIIILFIVQSYATYVAYVFVCLCFFKKHNQKQQFDCTKSKERIRSSVAMQHKVMLLLKAYQHKHSYFLRFFFCFFFYKRHNMKKAGAKTLKVKFYDIKKN